MKLFAAVAFSWLVLVASASREYDSMGGMFSPSGDLRQNNYAEKNVQNGPLCVGVRCKDGVILAIKKRQPPGMDGATRKEETANISGVGSSRTFRVNDHTGIVVAGTSPEALYLVQALLHEAHRYEADQGEEMRGQVVAQRAARLMHARATDPGRRTFPSALLVATWNTAEGGEEGQPELYAVNTAGFQVRCRARAFGAGSDQAQPHLEQRDFSTLTVKQAMPMVCRLMGADVPEEYSHPVPEVEGDPSVISKEEGEWFLRGREIEAGSVPGQTPEVLEIACVTKESGCKYVKHNDIIIQGE